MGNTKWSALIASARQKRAMTARQLAAYAGIDPSYVTRIERDGLVPRRDKVEAIAQALCLDEDFLLTAAGYVPDDGSREQASNELYTECELPHELVCCLRNLAGLSWEHQRDAARFLAAYLHCVTTGELDQR